MNAEALKEQVKNAKSEKDLVCGHRGRCPTCPTCRAFREDDLPPVVSHKQLCVPSLEYLASTLYSFCKANEKLGTKKRLKFMRELNNALFKKDMYWKRQKSYLTTVKK